MYKYCLISKHFMTSLQSLYKRPRVLQGQWQNKAQQTEEFPSGQK